jgi:Lrp/AsnC family transcriptional regulator, regulator of ectoine-degradation genes
MAIPKRRRSKPDALDLRILAALHRDGRISKTKLSADVGLSPTRCWERMRRMEDEGIIQGYHADISLRRLAGLSLFLVQIKLQDASLSGGRRFERMTLAIDEVICCEDVLGTTDYYIIVAATGVEAYQEVIERLSAQDSVKFDYITFPIARTVKSKYSVSLISLLARAPGI